MRLYSDRCIILLKDKNMNDFESWWFRRAQDKLGRDFTDAECHALVMAKISGPWEDLDPKAKRSVFKKALKPLWDRTSGRKHEASVRRSGPLAG